MISRFFIDRPVLANVLAILFVLIGAVALARLPIAEYPNVAPPTITVTTRYPGGSAQTLVDTVALPIERAVNGVEGMLYMQSTSTSDGNYSLTITFETGTDLNLAQIRVQNRVSGALPTLPQSVQSQGVPVRQQSTAFLQMITLSSPDGRYDGLYLSNYATINLVDELSRVSGVGHASVFGAGKYAMRIWLDPEKLIALGSSPQEIIEAVQQQSREVAAGQIGMPPTPTGQSFQYTVNVSGRLQQPEEFGDIVIKTDKGRITRLKDVARVELGAESYGVSFRLDGQSAAGIEIFQSPEANALATADRIKTKMVELARAFPPGLAYSISFDATKSVRASIHEVYKTLIEAAVLVLLVIVVFLQDWRAILVPATTVPVTIIGAFAAMAAFGFTINLASLFAVVLAIGIVVDDAIVIVEGASRHIEAGLSRRAAAMKAMDELFGPIVGITMVLMAVFIPAAFLSGPSGRMYAQFALVIAATALISAVNAATLKPTQCAMWLGKQVPRDRRNLIYRGFNRVYDRIEAGYLRIVTGITRRSLAMAALALVFAGASVWGILRLPTAFIPLEDQGYLMVAVQLPDGASLERTEKAVARVREAARAIPGVDQVIEIPGVSLLDSATLSSAGAIWVVLKDWNVRRGPGEDLGTIRAKLSQAVSELPDGQAFVFVPPPIPSLGSTGGFTMQVELRDGSSDYAELNNVARTIAANAEAQSALEGVDTSFRASVPQIRLEIDRTKAERLQVPVGDVFAALGAYLGSYYVNQFNLFGHNFQVYAQAEGKARLRASDIEKLTVKSTAGKMVPIGALATIEPMIGPAVITQYNLYPAATIYGSASAGFSSGEAMNLMEQIAAQTLPRGTGYEWTATSYQEKAAGNQIVYAFGLGLLLVYLCLAAQYESWIAPLAVILSVPLALAGPAAAFTALGAANDTLIQSGLAANNLYTQIGFVLLIALSAKNAILIVEVAREMRLLHGKPIVDAALDAARARFRPILMTSLAFILGVVPLVTATGAGATARISLGICVLTGMIASTGLAVLFVPSFFVALQRLEERLKGRPEAEPVPSKSVAA
jgi:hydrophobic/amphiphilic exporter-1 (mainly G- bacteria), HAE1 family